MRRHPRADRHAFALYHLYWLARSLKLAIGFALLLALIFIVLLALRSLLWATATRGL